MQTQTRMKVVSWNINGIRSVNAKNAVMPILNDIDPDVILFQEIKCSADTKEFERYEATYPHIYFTCAENRKGYSGVAALSKTKPLSVVKGMPLKNNKDKHTYDIEGRTLTLEYSDLFILAVYTPNSKPKLERLSERISEWEKHFLAYVNQLQTTKPVIIAGDLNVAHKEYDLHTTKGHNKSAGYTPEERAAFTELLDKANLVDAWRHQHPEPERAYTYFSNFARSRENNKGWRIDYTLISKALLPKLQSTCIYSDMKGSDHVPISIELGSHIHS